MTDITADGGVETVSVQWTAKRLRVSDMTVLRYIEDGTLRAFQMKPRGWWKISRASVLQYEERLRTALEGK